MVFVIAYAGASFMLNPTNPEARTQARSMLINVVVGMIILLSAWLVVDFIMKILYNDGAQYGPWNSILAPMAGDTGCIQATTPHAISGIIGNIANGTFNGSQTGTGGTGGTACSNTDGPRLLRQRCHALLAMKMVLVTRVPRAALISDQMGILSPLVCSK
jgi:hypothetical protein